MTAKITSKGQITIPKEVRDALGVSAGDRLHFTVGDGQAVVTPMCRRSASEFLGALALPDDNPGVKYVRELAAKYSGQELVRRLKEWEHEAVAEGAVERDRRVMEEWRRRKRS